MKKILLFGATPFQGGIETFIMNIYKTRGVDKEVSIYKFSDEKIAYQDILVKSFDAKILNNANPGGKFGHFYRKIQYHQFFKKNRFDIVHVNANSPSNYDFAKAALKSGAKVIYHSHNDSAESFVLSSKYKWLIKIVRKLQKKQLAKLEVKKIAVSINAAKWMFEEFEDALIVPNGVDFNELVYSEVKRRQGREQLAIGNQDIVLLVASRLTKQKNVLKSLSIAKIAIESGIAQHLIVVGDGQDWELLNRVVNEYPIEVKNHIHLLGAQSDMQLWYSVGDVMLMPSIYEGLPYTVLEAQASGLMIIASKAIPIQAVISGDLVTFIDVEKSDDIWLKSLESLNSGNTRSDYVNEANKSIYSLKNFKKVMDEIYETV